MLGICLVRPPRAHPQERMKEFVEETKAELGASLGSRPQCRQLTPDLRSLLYPIRTKLRVPRAFVVQTCSSSVPCQYLCGSDNSSCSLAVADFWLPSSPPQVTAPAWVIDLIGSTDVGENPCTRALVPNRVTRDIRVKETTVVSSAAPGFRSLTSGS